MERKRNGERKGEIGCLFPLGVHNFPEKILKCVIPGSLWYVQQSTDAGMPDSSPAGDSSTALLKAHKPQGHSF